MESDKTEKDSQWDSRAPILSALWMFTRPMLAMALVLTVIAIFGMVRELVSGLNGEYWLPGIYIAKKVFDITITMVVFILSAIYWIFLRRRKARFFRVRNIYLVLFWCVLSVMILVGRLVYSHAYHESLLKNITVIDVTISVYDADTRQPLKQRSIDGPQPASRFGQITEGFPRIVSTVSSKDGQEIVCQTVGPIKVKVGSDGYIPQKVILDGEGPCEKKVFLKRENKLPVAEDNVETGHETGSD